MATMKARVIHISIDRDWQHVYEFAHNPENMPRWAAGLASGLKQDGEDWIADGGPIGEVRVRFTPLNPFGVLDHQVTLRDGTRVDNALRVTPNGDGAEVAFLLFQSPDMDDVQFSADAAHVQKDLHVLKAILENVVSIDAL